MSNTYKWSDLCFNNSLNNYKIEHVIYNSCTKIEKKENK